MSDYDCETKEFLHISLSREFRVFVKMGGTLCGEYTQHTCVTPAATVTLISSSSTLMTRAGSPRSNSDGSSLVSAAKVSVLFGVHGISDTHTHIYIYSIHFVIYPLSSILSDASQKKTHVCVCVPDRYIHSFLLIRAEETFIPRMPQPCRDIPRT